MEKVKILIKRIKTKPINFLVGLLLSVMLLVSILLLYKIKAESASKYGYSNFQELKREVAAAEEKLKTVLKDNQSLKKQKEDLYAEQIEMGGNQHLKVIKTELDQYKVYAGLTDVQGEGVILKLDDKAGVFNSETDSYYSLVHDATLRHAVDLLLDAGTQALSINDQRLVFGSQVKCIGNTILYNDMRLGPPYIIKAIGDTEYLVEKIKNDEMFKKLKAAKIGLRVHYEIKQNIMIMAYQDYDQVEKRTNLLRN